MAGAGNREQVAQAVGRGGAFPKSARLLRHSDFDHVYRQGRRLFSAHMSVFWLRREAGRIARPGPACPGVSGRFQRSEQVGIRPLI